MGYELAKKIRELVPYEPIQGSFPVRLDANESCIDLNADTPLGDPALEAGRLRLREKIAHDSENPNHIRTVFGSAYNCEDE